MEPLKLVYSSAPADATFREQLSKHLRPLVQERLVVEWHDLLISPGDSVEAERRRAWRAADILVLLISADYFLPDIYDEPEVRAALERQTRGQLLVIPVLLRSCLWQATALRTLQMLPRGEQPLAHLEDHDAAFAAIAQELRQRVLARRGVSASTSELSALEQSNRRRLLRQVRVTWIEGLLQQSLHRAVWVDLHLQEKPDALENPWRLVVQELEHEPRPLPPGTSIIQVFDQADEELLILGEPGAGKTTLLLYLTRTLLERAEADERRRMPVVFPLSSWARQRLPFEQWLAEELRSKYHVPLKIARQWIATEQIFPLLDGLDEVAESAREACVQAIIAYTRRTGEHVPLVISCRNEEYQALSLQLPLQYAVMLLPFTNEQIDTYLSSVSGQVDVLRQTLYEDRELFELARSPLLLSVFTLTYHGATAADLPATTGRKDYPQALFRYYVRQMLKRRAHLRDVTEEQVSRWLTYLARQMTEQQQTIFALEALQPDWLPARARGWYGWSMVLTYALVFGLLFGPIFGLAFAGAYGLLFKTVSRLLFGLLFGLGTGMVGGFIGGLVFGIAFKRQQTIQPAEASAWSWSEARKGLLIGVSGGLVFGLIGALIGSLEGRTGSLVVGLAAASLAVLVSTIVGGLAPVQLAERARLVPNEGIWRSGRRGLSIVLLFILLFGICAGLVVGLIGPSIGAFAYGPFFGLILGAAGGLLFGLAFGIVGGRTGLTAFLKHFVLRLFLWRLKLLPWQLTPFLDETSERLILRKIGGQYIFVHRLLRDVLASSEQSGE